MKTKVYYIPKGLEQDMYFCVGDLLDNIAVRCGGKYPSRPSNITTGWLHHDVPLFEGDEKSLTGYDVFSIKTDGRDSRDWYVHGKSTAVDEESVHEGFVHQGFVYRKKAEKREFPFFVWLSQGDKGLYGITTLNQEVYGHNSFFVYPDRSCGDLIPGPCEVTGITHVNEQKNYAFVKCQNARYEMPEESAIAAYLQGDSPRNCAAEYKYTSIVFVKDSPFGDFAYLDFYGRHVTDLFVRDGEGIKVIPNIDASMLGGTIAEKVNVLDFLFQGYLGVSAEDVHKKFEAFPLNKRGFYQAAATDVLNTCSELMCEFCDDGIIRFRTFCGVTYADYVPTGLLGTARTTTKLLNYSVEEIDSVAKEFNQFNEDAAKKVRALVKNGKMPASELSARK